jgi:hypothetical protein
MVARVLFARRRLKKSGEQATATVLSCEYRSKLTSNELRDFDYVLEVHPQAGNTFEAKVRDKFWIAGLRPTEADENVPVRFDPSSKETVFDLDGDARYDADAMNEQTLELKKKVNAMKANLPPQDPPA